MSYKKERDKVFHAGYPSKWSIVKMDTPHKRGTRRLDQITLGVIHYTGSSNVDGTLSWFQHPDAKVSAHYVIDQDGAIVQFGEREDVLWHAGKSEWKGRKWCNKYSLGYEVVCGPKGQFTPAQYSALLNLLRKDIRDTSMTAVVGHEHISPGRKVDPGKCVNWDNLPLKVMDPDNKLEFLSNQRIEREDVIEEMLQKDQQLAAEKNIPIDDAKIINEIDRAASMGDGRGGTDLHWIVRILTAIFKRGE